MKKAVLKTILRDFFKLKYPLAMILVVIVLGAGLVWAGGALNTLGGGYRSNHNMPGMSAIASTTSGARAVIIGNTAASSDYFVPTRSPKEWTAFLTHCPAGITVAPAFSPAGTYYDHSIQCTDTNLTCPANFYCSSGNKYACSNGGTSSIGSGSPGDCSSGFNGCIITTSCADYVAHDCGTDNCGDSCGLGCPVNEVCSNKHACVPSSPNCHPNYPCEAGQCGTDDCGNACPMICNPANSFCNINHVCQFR